MRDRNDGRDRPARAHRGHLRRESQLRPPLWLLSRRRGDRAGNAGAENTARSRWQAATAPAAGLRPRQARSQIPAGPAQRSIPDHRAAREPANGRGPAEPDPRLLSPHRADQRRQEQHVRGHVEHRRLGDGALRRLADEVVEVGADVHACRPLFHGGVRRLVPESPVADLRLHPRARRCARHRAPPARGGRTPEEAADFAALRAAGTCRGLRRARHTRRLYGEHVAASLPAERYRARRGREPRPRRSRQAPGAAADAQDDRRHAQREGYLVGMVRRRVERGDGRRAARSEGEARGDLQPRHGQPDLPASPPSVQLLRAFRAGQR